MMTKEQKRRRQMKHTRKKSNGMTRPMHLLPVFVVAVVAFVFTMPATALAWHTVELEECEVFIEYNSTDGDFGIHFFWDGPPWKWMTVWNENTWPVLNVGTRENVRVQGLTEGFFESAEPTLEELPFQDFLDRFPEDEYRFRGRTLDWKRLVCETDFTHVIPCPPEIIEAVWNPDTVTLSVEWAEVTTVVDLAQEIPDPDEESPMCSMPVDELIIVGYEAVFELVVEGEDEEEQVFKETVILAPGTTMFTASPEFAALVVEAGDDVKELKFEVIAREASGNQTITESALIEEEE
jgi:hypothetical protein